MTISENTFTGEFNYTLDSKSRLNIPSKFRSALSPDNNRSFIITKGMDSCIVAYPLVEWQKRVESGLRELSATSQKNRLFVRSITRYATTVKLDGQGRIQLTSYLKDFANLDREVRIIGVINKIELWNPIDLEKLDDLCPQDFDDLSDKVVL
ncbi:MAG: division/cell wall cluster transcriptional repressor MraZ [Candidatus Marinimicrobia bacterium]|nr:division/cell wall cluster transcriptional repressor MraZ [Candidatus Neomarinimicrobiota bacterium]|tara:strand:- start:6383 stop:6838 length:456 start_codon:yes stop_codon:yes gene_type:complete